MIGVFGANGFIGTALTRRLVADQRAVKAVSRSFSKEFLQEFSGKVTLVVADFNDQQAVQGALNGITIAVNLVGSLVPDDGNRNLTLDVQTNLIPNVAFTTACISANVERLIFLSSGGTVYGQPNVLPIPEEHPCRPLNSYGLTKYCSEKYIEMLGSATGLKYSILRLANPYGPGQVFRNGQGLIAAILENARKDSPIPILGDGSAKRDYIFIEDAVDAIVRLIEAEGVSRQVFNIGSGCGRTIIEVLEEIEHALGKSLRKEYLPERKTDVQESVLDISKARSLLNWLPVTSFQDGIARTVSASG